MLKEMQKAAAYRDPTLGAAAITSAQADAMRAAASNTNGAAMAFMGMGMAQNAGGATAQNLYAMGQQQAAAQPAAPANAWKCSCGATVSGKFCPECGKPRPVDTEGWTCSCGTVNKGKFCMECGKPKPAGALQYRCDKCGWEVPKGDKPPKFCPECGDPFDDADIVR